MREITSLTGSENLPVTDAPLRRAPLTAEQQARLALEAALDKKALDPVLIDVREHSSYTDYILLLSGRSDRHVQSVADGVVEELVKHGGRPVGIEGQQQGQWTLIDFGDVVIHVFYHPMREFYDLESMWVDAARVPVEVPPDSRLQVTDAYM